MFCFDCSRCRKRTQGNHRHRHQTRRHGHPGYSGVHIRYQRDQPRREQTVGGVVTYDANDIDINSEETNGARVSVGWHLSDNITFDLLSDGLSDKGFFKPDADTLHVIQQITYYFHHPEGFPGFSLHQESGT